MLLSPEQFARLAEYASYSNRKLNTMLAEFQSGGLFHGYLSTDLQTIDFEGFSRFVNRYFGAELPTDLLQQLFLSFVVQHPLTDESPPPDRKPSVFEEALNSVKHAFQTSLTSAPRENGNNLLAPGGGGDGTGSIGQLKTNGLAEGQRIPLKPLVCYLSLLEGAPPEDKLEFVFHVYDSDDNGYLDSKEMESIIEQMMNVARYQHWDTIELEPILRQMMKEIDYDNDGIVSLEEWKRGGLTTIPLLVLLGFDTEMREDGSHIWRLRHFSKPTYCNVCQALLVGWGGRQGLACELCKYTVHERCVREAENSCIRTYNSNPSKGSGEMNRNRMTHHWLDSNTVGKCAKCKNTVQIFQGKRCRWCKALLHVKCLEPIATKDCDLGPLAYHILPPVNIVPAFLDRSLSQSQTQKRRSASFRAPSFSFSQNHAVPAAAGGGAGGGSGTGGNLLQAISLPSTSKHRPLLVLINPKSGGRQGQRIYRKFRYLLNPRQVYDLCKESPELGLDLFKTLNNYNVLVCGGDGTIGWVLETMDKMTYTDSRPPVAILPLGTGNDLSRCMKWGGGYENEPLQKILHGIEKANQCMLDRWQITIEQTKRFDRGDPQPYHIINNYFSIGVDASIAHRFHMMREKYPEKFNSRMRNKLWYFELGTSESISSTCKHLHEQVDVLCDGESIDLGNGPNLEGIAILNIGSIYGGSNLWGSSRSGGSSWHIPVIFPHITNSSLQLQHRVQDIGDKLIEVVGLESAMQMGQIKAGVRAARRLSQCSTVVIQTHKPFPMQIDGEPWMQPPCLIQIIHKNQVPMLIGNNNRHKKMSWNPLGPLRRSSSACSEAPISP